MELVANDRYALEAPSREAVVGLFDDQWVSALPGIASGTVPLFSDDRITWALDLAGGAEGKHVLELGPLEGGHSYMLQQAGAASVRAPEANSLCYLKCLLVQQLFGLDRVQFEFGNFVPWLAETDETYDLVVAAGVLYHLADPVPVLDKLCRMSSQIYLWTHFVDLEQVPATDKRYKRWFVDVEQHEYAGRSYALHRRVYKKNPTSDPKFIGGVHTTTAWIEKQTILDVFEAHGFDVQVAHEDATNRSGPCGSFYAERR